MPLIQRLESEVFPACRALGGRAYLRLRSTKANERYRDGEQAEQQIRDRPEVERALHLGPEVAEKRQVNAKALGHHHAADHHPDDHDGNGYCLQVRPSSPAQKPGHHLHAAKPEDQRPVKAPGR